MSYILDALKKLEHEKSKKSRGEGILNISGALFENERQKTAGSAGWRIALTVALAVVVTFAATWQFLQSGKSRRVDAQHVVAPIPPTPLPTEAAPVPPVSANVPQGVPQQNAPANVQTLAQPATHSPVHAAIPKASAPAAAPAEDAAAILTQQELRKRQKDRKGLTASAAPTIAPPADIKLSGIAYQDERRARRAVVNGFLMQEGGIVSGAVITDIYQDRVRFSLPSGSFELPLTANGNLVPGK